MSIFLIIVYAFSAFLGNGFVLCDEGNGYSFLELEHQGDPHCSVHKHINEDNKPITEIDKKECTHCEDTPILSENTIRVQRDVLKISNSPAIEPFSQIVNFGSLSCFEESLYAKPPPRLNSTLSILRTVILII